VLDNVLDTTLALLAEHGYAFSVDDVARTADVHKTTIYRHWPTKAALIGGAVARLAQVEIDTTRSDDPIADLTRLALGVARTLRTGAAMGALRAVLAAAVDDPEIVPMARQFLTSRYRLAVDILRDASDRGVIRDDVDPTLIWEAIVNPLHLRSVLGTPADDDVARMLVSIVVDGARGRSANPQAHRTAATRSTR
jgi:AcrR family transcriptional regulator